MKKNKDSVEFIVLKCFIRTIKSDGKYMLYRCGVNNSGIMKALVKRKKQASDSPFLNSSSTEEVVDTLKDITNQMAKSNGKKGGIKDLDKYEHVTMTINHLLHFFMESNGISMEKLCSMGEKIYNLSCNKLFGDEIGENNEDEMANIETQDQLRAKLFQDYVMAIERGEIKKTVTFQDYVNSHLSEINSKVKIDIPTNQGQCLGPSPEERNGDFRRVNWLDDVIDDGWR